jgi:hypothetical protein
MALVAGDKHSGASGDGNLQERQIVLVRKLEPQWFSDDQLAVFCDEVQESVDFSGVEREARPLEHLSIFCENSVVIEGYYAPQGEQVEDTTRSS